MNNINEYLYRGLRKEEVDAGNRLIPKSQESFMKHPRLSIDTRLPFKLGKQEEYAVRQHQWKREDIDGDPTSGISTTPHFERAKHYAKEGIVVKINRNLIENYGIKECIVKDILGKFPDDIAHPEDEEVILVNDRLDKFPKGIVEEVIQV